MKAVGTIIFALFFFGASRPQLLQAASWNAPAGITILHSFGVFPKGANPQAALVLGRDGNFYGTTCNGGTNGGNGTVFRITPGGILTSLYSFTGGNDGTYPNAALVQGWDGDFYGTTSGGGSNGGNGTIFRITANGALTSLYSFTGGGDGGFPGSLAQGSDGSLFGTASGGGRQGQGTIFRITPQGALTSLYSFTGNADGSGPVSLTLGSDGDFYGATSSTIFRITPGGVLRTLASIFGAGSLAQGSDGNFYGTQSYGGAAWDGTIFRITPGGVLHTMYSFQGGDDGRTPNGLTQGSDGNFYGTTSFRGSQGHGTFFRITPSGAFTPFYSFADNLGAASALVLGNDGSFYATTADYAPVPPPIYYTSTPTGSRSSRAVAAGEANADSSGINTTTNGTVFKITPGGKFSSLYFFTGLNDGGSPQCILKGLDGKLYGTTANSYNAPIAASVFNATTNGTFSILYSFPGFYGSINLTLVQGSDGNFYGTENDIFPPFGPFGSVFEITPGGQFTNWAPFGFPEIPAAALVQGSDGNFYRTTTVGWEGGGFILLNPLTPIYDTFFRITTNGGFTSLYSFTNGSYDPSTALVQGRDGNFYGSETDGTIFEITPDGTFSSLYSFTNGLYGAGSVAALVLGNDGNFYGSTSSGGSNNFGTIFKITTNGLLTSLYSFTNGTDGANPNAALIPGSDGNFYGFTGGGVYGCGTVFQITPNGAFTSLYSFAGGNGGANVNSLVQGNDGNFYGTTSGGGAGASGTLFRLSIQYAPAISREAPGQLHEPAGSVLTLGATVNGMPPLTYQWQMNGVDLSDGENFSGSAGCALTINPAMITNSGSYRLIVSNSYGAVTSAVTALTVTADTVSPTVSISTPAANARTTNGVISGAALDNVQVVAVDYWLTNFNNGVTETAGQAVLGPGTTNRTWTIPGPPLPGSNTVLVQSVDFTGNKSPRRPRAFFYKVPSLFTLTKTGDGAVTGTASIRGDLPPTNGAMLNIGERYTLAATSARNWWLTNWTSGASVAGTNTTLRFIMENGTDFQANFVTNPFVQLAGKTYNGLFYSVVNGAPNVTEESAGMISGLTVNAEGIFSGQLAVNGTNYVLSGAFNRSGQATAAIPRSGAEGGNLEVSLDLSALWNTNASVRGIQGRVAAASYVYYPPQPIYPTNGPIPLVLFEPVVVGGWTNALFLFASTTNGASGEYTMLLPPGTSQTGQPPGTGYVLITNRAGMMICNGALADGAGVCQTMPANEDGFAPMFVNLYTNTGLLLGWVNVAANAADAAKFETAVFGGTGIAWIKQSPGGPNWGLVIPDGFTRTLVPVLSLWTNQPVLSLAGAQLEVTGGPVGTNSLTFTNLVISAHDALSATAAGGLKLSGSYSPKTGLLKIKSIFLGGGERGTGAVALFQTNNAESGAGYFTTATNDGSIILQP